MDRCKSRFLYNLVFAKIDWNTIFSKLFIVLLENKKKNKKLLKSIEYRIRSRIIEKEMYVAMY